MKKSIMILFLCMCLFISGCSTSSTSKQLSAKELFNLKTSSIEDEAVVNAIINGVEIPANLGSHSLYYQITGDPLYVNIEFDTVWDSKNIVDYKTTMIKKSLLILSLIDNADAVVFSYRWMDTDEEMTNILAVTPAYAESLLSSDIHSYSDSEESVADLLKKLDDLKIEVSE